MSILMKNLNLTQLNACVIACFHLHCHIFKLQVGDANLDWKIVVHLNSCVVLVDLKNTNNSLLAAFFIVDHAIPPVCFVLSWSAPFLPLMLFFHHVALITACKEWCCSTRWHPAKRDDKNGTCNHVWDVMVAVPDASLPPNHDNDDFTQNFKDWKWKMIDFLECNWCVQKVAFKHKTHWTLNPPQCWINMMVKQTALQHKWIVTWWHTVWKTNAIAG